MMPVLRLVGLVLQVGFTKHVTDEQEDQAGNGVSARGRGRAVKLDGRAEALELILAVGGFDVLRHVVTFLGVM